MDEVTNFLCRTCHQVGPQHEVNGIGQCAYCGSRYVTTTTLPLARRWKGGPGQRFFVRTKRGVRGAE